MIRPSPELLSITRRLFDAGRDRDAATLRNLYAENDIVRFVGSDPRENWAGPKLREGLGAHYKELPGTLDYEILSAEAFEAGETGWAFVTYRYHFDGIDEPRIFRNTLVFALENGAWKIIHRHASLGVENLDVYGVEHSALEELMDAAREAYVPEQREGMASILFTDIVGSSQLAAAMGDRLWSARVGQHFDDLRAVVEAEGGQFVKSMGDGTMSSFTSARAALSAAAAIQKAARTTETEPVLPLRIGLHCGDVIQTEDDFFGNVVNKAARIAASAGMGEVRVSDAIRIMASGVPEFRFRDAATLTLKGLEGEHVVHQLAWQQ